MLNAQCTAAHTSVFGLSHPRKKRVSTFQEKERNPQCSGLLDIVHGEHLHSRSCNLYFLYPGCVHAHT